MRVCQHHKQKNHQREVSHSSSYNIICLCPYYTLYHLFFFLINQFLSLFINLSQTGTFQMTLRSPERRLKVQPNVLKTAQAAPTTPQRAQTSKVKESMRTPPKQHTGEISGVCRVQLEKLSIEEICTPQSVLQPKHHSTPVTVKTILSG